MKRKIIGFGVWIGVMVLAASINLAMYHYNADDIVIRINKYKGRSFISESEVKKILSQLREQNPDIITATQAKTAVIEETFRQIDYVKDAQVSRDIKGTLFVEIEQEVPLARVIPPYRQAFYLTDDGRILPFSQSFTPRVLVITGKGADSLAWRAFIQSLEGQKIMTLLHSIERESFWKAQIAQIDINERLELTFFTLVGEHAVEFGKAENLDAKFSKLRTFYRKIIPAKGWGAYRRVKVQYEGQIVCE